MAGAIGRAFQGGINATKQSASSEPAKWGCAELAAIAATVFANVASVAVSPVPSNQAKVQPQPQDKNRG